MECLCLWTMFRFDEMGNAARSLLASGNALWWLSPRMRMNSIETCHREQRKLRYLNSWSW